jgi:hypothetical protein
MNSVSRVARRITFVGAIAVLASAAALYSNLTHGASPAESRLLDDIRYLASDELEGRGIGTKGLDKASEFVRDAFQKAGLKEPSKGWYQPFAMISGSELASPNSLAFVGAENKVTELKVDSDFRTLSFGGSGVRRGSRLLRLWHRFVGKYQEFEGST